MDISHKSIAIAAVAALAFGGSAIANAAGSSSSASNGSTSTATAAAVADTDNDGRRGGQHAGETLVTGSELTKLTAAARDELGSGATIDRVETNSDGGGSYEAHATKADGTQVTVLFSKAGAVASVEDGMGPGGPAGANG